MQISHRAAVIGCLIAVGILAGVLVAVALCSSGVSMGDVKPLNSQYGLSFLPGGIDVSGQEALVYIAHGRPVYVRRGIDAPVALGNGLVLYLYFIPGGGLAYEVVAPNDPTPIDINRAIAARAVDGGDDRTILADSELRALDIKRRDDGRYILTVSGGPWAEHTVKVDVSEQEIAQLREKAMELQRANAR